VTGTVRVTVRFFAAARAAAGADSVALDLPDGATCADAVEALRGRGGGLPQVLAKCSYLCDGVAVRDSHGVLRHGQTLDVLPPFAGG
jgi:sulfur-carrier protein